MGLYRILKEIKEENNNQIAINEGIFDIFKRKTRTPEELAYRENCIERSELISVATDSIMESLFNAGLVDLTFSISFWSVDNREFELGKSVSFNILMSVNSNVGVSYKTNPYNGKQERTIDMAVRAQSLAAGVKEINSSKQNIIQQMSDDIKYNVNNLKVSPAYDIDKAFITVYLENIPFT